MWLLSDGMSHWRSSLCVVVESHGAFAKLPGLGEMLRERRIVWQAFGPHVRIQGCRQRIQSARPELEAEGDEGARAAHTAETG
jgi:hypothetical protein